MEFDWLCALEKTNQIREYQLRGKYLASILSENTIHLFPSFSLEGKLAVNIRFLKYVS